MNKIFLYIVLLLGLFHHDEIKGQEKHFLTFYGTKDGPVGHAFVSFVREDNNLQMTLVEGCWGFYPKVSAMGGASFFIGEVTGAIKDDIQKQRDIGLTVEVSKAEYLNALQIKEKWNTKPYELTTKDCISFVQEVASSISKLCVPTRLIYDFPHDYIEDLKHMNDFSTICSSHLDLVDNYNKKHSSYHIYTHTSLICDSKDNPCCTEEFVFEIMKSRAEFTAPYAGAAPLVDCGQIDLPGFGSIVTKFGNNPRSITNYTKCNHILHAGKVVRNVVKVGTKINIYTVGTGNNKNAVLSYLNSNSSSVKFIWGGVNEKLKKEVEKQLKTKNNCGNLLSTLFLFDLSGSMSQRGGNSSKTKLAQAKDASKQTLAQLKNNQSGISNEVAVLGFSGGCTADPTIPVSGFETDLSLVENRINGMRAGGGTPLAEAIAAAECKLADHLYQNNQDKGKLIILSDGVATCSKIRPSGVYNSGQLGQQINTVSANQCGNGSTLRSSNPIKYYTIGFNIAPGTPAERDLQYLAQISGGKYLNVQNQVQLERAFRKFNRTYIPKEQPQLNNLPSSSNNSFSKTVQSIHGESFSKALKESEAFVQLHPNDCHGIYNLALMQEANDFYQVAIKNYRQCLSMCPSEGDKEFVEQQIKFLEEEFKQFLLFQKEILKSDLAYLKLHFEKIQNGESVALANEFKGFIKEKGDFYLKLPEKVGRTEKLFIRNSKEVAKGLKDCSRTIQRNPAKWDRDATPSLSMTYLSLERLIESF